MKIAVLPGDGIGPEVINEALKVFGALKLVNIELTEALIGRTAFQKAGNILPDSTIKAIESSDAVLLGAVGKNFPEDNDNVRPERALLAIRKQLNCYSNIRTVKQYSSFGANKPSSNYNLMIVRELNSGIYFGEPRGIRKLYFKSSCSSLEGFSTSKYSTIEVESIARIAFELALKRRKKVLLVDKANVLETSRVWRKIVCSLAGNYSEVKLSFSYIDSASIEIFTRPSDFDVILTENLFGDILSDQLSNLVGSLGMMPSASIGFNRKGLYEPAHGSAPSLTKKNIANPIATILSLAMLLRYSLSLPKEASIIEEAVEKVLQQGFRTIDICQGLSSISTAEMGDRIATAITNG